MTIIETYSYTYGAGSQPNRKIAFQKNPSGNPESIIAVVTALHDGKEIITSRITGDHISVEMMSTSDKVNAFMRARQEDSIFTPPSDRKLSSFSIVEQERIIKSLEPVGTKRIEVTNDFGGPAGLEKVVHITIFDPK